MSEKLNFVLKYYIRIIFEFKRHNFSLGKKAFIFSPEAKGGHIELNITNAWFFKALKNTTTVKKCA